MADKKARCFSVTLRNGHGPYEIIVPAQSKSNLENNLHVPDNEKLLSIKNLGFHTFSPTPDHEADTIRFDGVVGTKEVCVTIGNLGHEHLRQLFADDVKAIDDYFNPDHDEP